MQKRVFVAFFLVLMALALVLTPVANAAPLHEGSGVWYTVRWGDTLWRISRQYGVTVSAIVAANGLYSANRIWAGQRLFIPTSGSPTPQPSSGCNYQVYLVSRGDTLWSLSRRFGVSTWAILQANHLWNPNLLYVGQRLTIPKSSFTIDSPVPNAVLNGSVHVSGTASGIFENTFTVEVRTAEGTVLVRQSVGVNTTEMGHSGPYAADLTFTPPATTRPGRVVVYDNSAMDGSVIDQNCVAVTLQGSGG